MNKASKAKATSVDENPTGQQAKCDTPFGRRKEDREPKNVEAPCPPMSDVATWEKRIREVTNEIEACGKAKDVLHKLLDELNMRVEELEFTKQYATKMFNTAGMRVVSK